MDGRDRSRLAPAPVPAAAREGRARGWGEVTGGRVTAVVGPRPCRRRSNKSEEGSRLCLCLAAAAVAGGAGGG